MEGCFTTLDREQESLCVLYDVVAARRCVSWVEEPLGAPGRVGGGHGVGVVAWGRQRCTSRRYCIYANSSLIGQERKSKPFS